MGSSNAVHEMKGPYMEHYVMDVMTTNPMLDGIRRAAVAVAAEARERGVAHVVVTDGAHAVGVVEAWRLASAEPDATVGDLLSGRVVTVDESRSLDAAEAIMDRSDMDCLPVTNWAGLIVGVITRGDIRRHWEECPASARSHADPVLTCAACGAPVESEPDPEACVAFCDDCLSRSHRPRESFDALYFTLGGGG
jgi:hypothetical protein